MTDRPTLHLANLGSRATGDITSHGSGCVPAPYQWPDLNWRVARTENARPNRAQRRAQRLAQARAHRRHLAD